MNPREPVVVRPDDADPEVVRELGERIAAIVKQKGLEAVVEVGQLLFARVHAGRRDRVGPSATIAAIAAQPGYPVKAGTLYRWVGVYLQWLDMEKDVRDRLDRTQHYALLPLTDDEAKDRLAREAAETGMASRELAARVRDAEGRPEPKPGRPPAKAPSVSRATRLLSPWRRRIAAGKRPSPSEADRVRAHVRDLRALLDELDRWATPAEEADGDGATPTAAGRFQV